MHEFKHPKYYKELRARNKSDQAISSEAHDGERERASDPGLKPQASSNKRQASSFKPQAASSMILEPRKSFTAPEPRCGTMMNVFSGWRVWKLI